MKLPSIDAGCIVHLHNGIVRRDQLNILPKSLHCLFDRIQRRFESWAASKVRFIVPAQLKMNQSGAHRLNDRIEIGLREIGIF